MGSASISQAEILALIYIALPETLSSLGGFNE